MHACLGPEDAFVIFESLNNASPKKQCSRVFRFVVIMRMPAIQDFHRHGDSDVGFGFGRGFLYVSTSTRSLHDLTTAADCSSMRFTCSC